MSSGDLSSCCKAPVKIDKGEEEIFDDSFRICTKCGQPCGLVNPEDRREER